MLKIETGPKNTILRTISEEIKPYEMDRYIKLGREMIKYVKNPKNQGVGLAAPQIGVNKRIVVVSMLKTWEDENFPTIMMINPEILEFGTQMDSEKEGCLSLPGERGEVERYTSLKLTYIDEKKKRQTLQLSGTVARIVQHEVDHINGMLYIDRVKK